MSSFVMWLSWVSCVAFAAGSVACAAGDTPTGGNGTGASASGGSGGTGAGGAAGGAGGTAGAGGDLGGGGQGGALSGEVEVCVLNEGGPYDACQDPPQLDFGVVSAGTAETRVVRLDNQTEGELLVKSATVANGAFDVKAVRFEEDPGSPGSYLRVEQALPATRPSGTSLWFEVKYTAAGSQGALPALDLVVKLNLDNQAIADELVPIVGEESGCPPGSGACDTDPNNGCETNTDTSLEHCGGCNHPCDPLGATGQCVNGTCEIAGCDQFMDNCDLLDSTGCEANLLNDVANCGMCGLSCVKANTSSFCNGGNCNITGCQNNYADCNLMPVDGCETNLAIDMQNCGGCNLPCALAHAAESCIPSAQTGLGVCTLGACDPGYENCNLMAADGCEINKTNDVNNCGNCFSPCAFDHAAESCVNSACVLGNCDPGYDNCDAITANGCETNLTNNKDHCGTCAIDCDVTYPGSNVSCVSSACQFNGCATNYWNLDGSLANGCEYFCVQQAGPDLPDSGYVDSNCDGIDGDVNAAIFVATTGNDANAGTKSAPMATVIAAIGRAQTSGKTQIYISNGTYLGRVTLVNGISLYGGYSATNNWARADGYTAIIRSTVVANSRVTALEGNGISSATTVDRLSIQTGTTTQANTNNYAVYCTGCTALTLSRNIIDAGSAGPGANGTDGAVGIAGNGGGAGGPGSCDGSSQGTGGTAGTSSCSRNGGTGGTGGNDSGGSGTNGTTGQIGTSGGIGGGSGDPGGDGANGATGTSGSQGSGGGGGLGGTVTGGFWVSANGSTGALGTAGNGGGGGGGGGGQDCLICNNGAGDGGGGGGGAGCGGSGGSGGTGGGGSFGVFLVSSTGVQLVSNTVTSGNGGNGGNGGAGGNGGTGGGGGTGSTYCSSEVGTGGNGGAGGSGGRGGGGGGGAGGPSWAVYRSGTVVNTAGNALANGAPGSGGVGGTPSGVAGFAGSSGLVN
ncbi:MAG: hypothetical protein U0271_04700 [Polyangiaceae bacterium]